jgi:hypothetical protein
MKLGAGLNRQSAEKKLLLWMSKYRKQTKKILNLSGQIRTRGIIFSIREKKFSAKCQPEANCFVLLKKQLQSKQPVCGEQKL